MAEYYIRAPGSEEARGPFDEEKMTSLADAGQITLTTEFFDEPKNAWVPVGDSAEMKALLFPERKRLGLKKDRSDVQMLNKPEEANAPAVTVTQMLAAAEGESKETSHLKDRLRREEKSAALALPVLGVMMVLSGLTNTVPYYQLLSDVFLKYKWELLFQQPFAVVGLADFFLALCLFLNVPIFPIVRFRAMIGMGYFCFVYWSLGNPMGLIAAVCAGLGLLVCSVTNNLFLMLFFALCGVGGMGTLAYFAWMLANSAAPA